MGSRDGGTIEPQTAPTKLHTCPTQLNLSLGTKARESSWEQGPLYTWATPSDGLPPLLSLEALL